MGDYTTINHLFITLYNYEPFSTAESAPIKMPSNEVLAAAEVYKIMAAAEALATDLAD